MLTALRISGFALLDEVEVEFGPGMNVVTGETGAGKSILLEALHLVLGGRMSPDVLRDGADEVVVEALFDVSSSGHPIVERVRAAGVPVEEGATELLVRRTASRSGRGRVFVNGALCTVGMLQTSFRGLVDITTQHEHVSLLDESTHLALLDGFAGLSPEAAPLIDYRAAWSAVTRLARERDALTRDRDARVRRAGEAREQLSQIEAVSPKPNEVEELERERHVLAAAERLRGAARTAEALVYSDEGSASERLARAVRALGDAATLDERLAPALDALRVVAVEAEEAGRMLARYAEGIDGDPERLVAVEDRLAAVRALLRKYGGTAAAALERAASLRDELATVDDAAERIAALDGEIDDASRAAVDAARAVSALRGEAARKLARQVQAELDALGMAGCRVELELAPPPGAVTLLGVSLGTEGAETVRMLLAPNPGEPPRPLARIASGGELSRVMLAMKRALARVDPVDTYVFDEVDAGIGGAVAEVVGRLLSSVSRQRQVICVTHLPQVAAFADRHFRVEKRVRRGRTTTVVTVLDAADDRRREVARMLAGLTLTESALQHAAALIAGAHTPPARDGARSDRRRVAPASAGAARVVALTPRVRG